MSEFLQMGGYAPYVWSAYGFTLLVVIFNVWSAYRRHEGALSRARGAGGPRTPAPRPTVRQMS